MSSGAERRPSAPAAGREPPVHEATIRCRACGWAGAFAALRLEDVARTPEQIGIPDAELVCPRCGSLDLDRVRL